MTQALGAVMFEFDARTVSPQMGFEPVPEGWYKVRIVKSAIQATAAGDGGMLVLDAEIIDGQYAGKVTKAFLNLFNQSQTAVDMAYRTLSAICHVTGVMNIRAVNSPDSAVQPLHGIPFHVYLTVTDGKNGKVNNWRGYKDINGNEPGKSGAAGQPPTSAPQPAPQPPQQAMQPPQGVPPTQPAMQPAPQGQPQWGGQSAPQGQPGPGWTQPAAPQPTPQPAMQPPQGQPQWSGGAPTQPAPQPQGGPGWQPTPGAQQAAAGQPGPSWGPRG